MESDISKFDMSVQSISLVVVGCTYSSRAAISQLSDADSERERPRSKGRAKQKENSTQVKWALLRGRGVDDNKRTVTTHSFS